MVKKKELLAQLDELLKCEEIYWSQKTKCKWLKECDENTKFFHRMASGKNWKNLITRMEIEGEIVEVLERIKEEAIRYYSTLYSKKDGNRLFIDNLFSTSLGKEAKELEVPFLVEEIREAVFNMAGDKSSGPDGFFMCFY